MKTDEWYYQWMGEVVGPLPIHKLKEYAARGEIGRDTMIRKGKGGKWVPAHKVEDLWFGLPESDGPMPGKNAKARTAKVVNSGDSADIRLRRETVARITGTSADSEQPVTKESAPTGQHRLSAEEVQCRRERYQRRQGDLSGWSISLAMSAVVGFVGLIGWAASNAASVFGVGAGSASRGGGDTAVDRVLYMTVEEKEKQNRLKEYENQLWKEHRREEREEEQTRLLREINDKLKR